MTNALPNPTGRSADQIIGANIHTLMWNRGDKQTALAPAWGMDQTTLSAKLRGKRPWYAHEIEAAARRYGVSIDVLFTQQGIVGSAGFEPAATTVESGRLAEVIPFRRHAA